MNSMTDSKIFVGLKPTRGKRSVPAENTEGSCQWDDCDDGATARAPVGQEAEGLYLRFCNKHVREYNRGYNYYADLSDQVVAGYQRTAALGSRATSGAVHRVQEAPLPSSARSGSAKALNARKAAAQGREQKRQDEARKLKVLEAKAFEALGLDYEATPVEIKRRYKELLKLHHPDANEGDRGSESQLQAVIDAHKILKVNGFC